ncbi:MAG: 4Fe-4S dicluster domain-containing protein [Armatimonadetes bacterium]|nr:4Fe-4S dicluster domain-containing protein [Armatimonadota bacterium]
MAIAPSEQAACVRALSAMVARRAGSEWSALRSAGAPGVPPEAKAALESAAAALLAARGRGLVVADSGDVDVQLLVAALNEALGSAGRTADLSRPSLQKQGRDADMIRLIEEMVRGEVAVLLVHGCNPAYTWPEAGAFVAAMKRVPCSVSFATAPDETSAAATHHCPAHHPMEAWGDAEPQVGRFSLFQPTIRPLYQTRAFEESLLTWGGRGGTFHEYLKRHWAAQILPRQRAVPDWDAVLQRGFVEVAPPPRRLPALPAAVAAAAAARLDARGAAPRSLEVEVFQPVAMGDGSGANNAWLQELPDPITKIAWDNAALISPALAREKGIAQGQLVALSLGGRSLKLPAHIQPGQHARTLSVALGYGRRSAGPVGSGLGADAYPLVRVREGRRQGAAPLAALSVAAAGAYEFARTQVHGSMEGRPIVQEIAPDEHAGERHDAHAGVKSSLWEEHEYPDYKWGMAIDLEKCTGCSACVASCDIENNVPAVGRDEVRRSREMHWLRIDRYYTGDPAAPRVLHQPMLCQHCDNASCETVCPALATVHDDQGLNVQVYNRCVGTRYCANNCPYKVRRFNWFNHDGRDPVENLGLNPDVTVRTRGVMEKCSFCIQRIQAARLEARREGRAVRDGEVRTACEQSCPADAIVFGNLADPNSRVSQIARSGRSYRVLEELNRRPAVHYLAKVKEDRS